MSLLLTIVFRLLFLLFIFIPLIEIAVFIQVGDAIGLLPTVAGVVLTAVIGVQLLRQQGISAWQDIQLKLASGGLPAVEMASAAQLLVAGALLLTPGFVTDSIGFALLFPQVRQLISQRLLNYWQTRQQTTGFYYTSWQQESSHSPSTQPHKGRIIDGEAERDDH